MTSYLPTKELLYFSILICGLITGFFRLSKLSKSSKIILGFLILTVISELLSEVCARIFSNNMFVFHIYNALKFPILAIAFDFEINKKKILRYISVTVIMFSIYNGIFLQPFMEEYCSYVFNLNVILISSLSLYYLYRLLKEDTDNQFTDYPLFWISIGYLIHNSINILGLGSFNILTTDPNLSYILEVIRTLSNYLLYALFIVSFLSKQKSLTN